jgi:hypothetical protein
MAYNRNKPIANTKKEEVSSKPSEVTEKAKAKSEDKVNKKKPKANKTATRKKTRDPRIAISIGAFFMLLSVFVLLSFISYVIGYTLTGNFGDTIGMWLSRNAFGIGSLYLIFLLFIAGSNLTFKGPKIKMWTICKYALMSLVWLPLALATILPNNNAFDTFYGVVGLFIHDLLVPFVQEIGIYILLVFFAFLYVIFTFDIKMPTINWERKVDTGSDTDTDNNSDNNSDFDKNPVSDTDIEFDDDDEEWEDVEITVKHIDKDPIEDSNKEEDIEDVEIIDITPTPKQIPYTTETTTIEDEGFEDVEIELEIFKYCVRQKKKMRKKLFEKFQKNP